MPTFDYICLNCRKKFEETVSFGFKGKLACPKCKSRKTQKLISVPGIVFKGSGFYKTDSRKTKVENKPSETEKTKIEKTNGSTAPQGGDYGASKAKIEKKDAPIKKTEKKEK